MLNDLPPSQYLCSALNKLQADILRLNAQGLTWRQIGNRYCITHSMAYRIATQPGYLPADPEIRHRLGLDAITPPEILEDRLHWVLDLSRCPMPTHDEILAELPKPYLALVDKSTANGIDLDRAIIYTLTIMASAEPWLFKKIKNKVERKDKK